MEINTDSLKLEHYFIAATVAITGVAVGFRKVLKMWQTDSRDIAKIGAETDIVNMLRTELERVTQTARNLSDEVERLQKLMGDIQAQNLQLKSTLEMLRSELEKLRSLK